MLPGNRWIAHARAVLLPAAIVGLLAPSPARPDPPLPASCGDAGLTFEQASTARTEYAFDSPGHVVEADGIAWLDAEEDAIELLGSEAGCWRGGLIDGPYGDDSVYECKPEHCPGGVCPTPCLAYHTDSCMTPETSAGAVVEDLACTDYGDGISRKLEAGDLVVRRAHLYDLKDDAVEDDYGLSNTRIFDTLIDGAHIAFGDRQRSSQDNDATGTEWEVRDSLVRVRPNVNPYKQRPGHGGIWKGDPNPSHQHRYRLTDNVFVAQGKKRGGQLFPTAGYVDECAGNVLLWAGPITGTGGWLEELADDDDRPDGLTDGQRLGVLNASFPGCFLVVLKPEAQSEADFLATPHAELGGSSWDELVAAWLGAPPTTTTTTTTTAPPTTTTTTTTTSAPTTTTTTTTTAPPTTTTTTTTTTAPPTTTTTTTTAPPTTTTTTTTTTPPTTTTTTTTTAPPTTTSTTSTTSTTTTPPASPPSVAILSPAPDSIVSEGAVVGFAGSASDPESGDVSASLVWISQKDGWIGSGPSFAIATLSKGKHTITATATDPDGNTGSATISLRVRR